MKKLSYDKLMAHNPTQLDTMVNQRGQTVTFYEHPTAGDEWTVLGVIDKTAFDTDFWDTGDFFEDSDYNPILLDSGDVVCQFEAEKEH